MYKDRIGGTTVSRTAPDGRGGGYIVAWDRKLHRKRPIHCIIWEIHNGPIPDGMEVHHIDEDKANNTIENLQLLDARTHQRLHAGWELRDDVWFKRCSVCRAMKPIGEYHTKVRSSRNGALSHNSRCKPCHSAYSKVWSQRKRDEQKVRKLQEKA